MKVNVNRLIKMTAVVVLILDGLVPCPVLGQGIQKKQLTEEDYGLWGSLRTFAVSDNGLWVSYKISYPSGNDTLFVKSTRSTAVYSLPKTPNGFFVGNGRYAFLAKGQVEIIALDSGIKTFIREVQDCQPVNSGRYLLATASDNGNTCLNLYDLDGRLLQRFCNIAGYALNNAKDALLYTQYENQSHAISIARLNKKSMKTSMISNSRTPFSKLAWSKDDKAVAFQSLAAERSVDPGHVYLYDIGAKKLHSLSDKNAKTFPDGQRLSSDNALHLRISDDHKRVFFGAEDNAALAPVREEDLVEIWKHNDTILYPVQRQVKRYPRAESHLAAWNVDSNSAVIIGRGQFRWALLAGNARYVISSGNATDFRDLRYYQHTDYYITDAVTGATSLVLASHPGPDATFSLSPDGRYLTYLKDGNWWTYDTQAKKHTNTTVMLYSQWDTSRSKPGYSVFSFGITGWDHDGNILINDEHDIWSVSPNGAGGKRITRGKEAQLSYRLAAKEGAGFNPLAYSSSSSRLLDLRKGIYLSWYNTQNGVSGYTRLEKGKIIPLSSGRFNAGNLLTCQNPGIVLYEQQGYDLPPRIVAYDIKQKASKVIVESNTHHRNFKWGRSEIISYNVGTDSLKGVLIYPAGYMAGEKYPMITYIYERLLHRAQEYVNPSPYDVMGFNITNLSAKGYFILLPDIRYRPGHTGQSALECVTAAVEKVVRGGRVDPGKIGIIGHSFGGFETNYIIAHSKLFAAAISGAGISDPIYAYLSYGEGTTEIDYWRYEDQQFRIGKGFFEAPELYIENSPLFSAADITTPLLIWSGKKDPVVNPDQSFIMYAAMRRLKKKSILLLYPDEVHALALKKNQADLTMRTESWFGHYLRGMKADWIE